MGQSSVVAGWCEGHKSRSKVRWQGSGFHAKCARLGPEDNGHRSGITGHHQRSGAEGWNHRSWITGKNQRLGSGQGSSVKGQVPHTTVGGFMALGRVLTHILMGFCLSTGDCFM